MVQATSERPAGEREAIRARDQARINAMINRDSETVKYDSQKRGKRISSSQYESVIVEETASGYVRRERDTYLKDATGSGNYRRAVYDKRVEYYDNNGVLVKVETYDKYKRLTSGGERRVYKSGEIRYSNGVPVYEYRQKRKFKGGDIQTNYTRRGNDVQTNDYRSPPKKQRATTVYEFEVDGKTYRTGSADFVEQKTGIDPRKLDNKTIVLRDTATNKSDVFRIEGRDEQNPKQAGLAVRVQKPSSKPANKAPVITSVLAPQGAGASPQTPPPTTASPYYDLPAGDFGSNVSSGPPGEITFSGPLVAEFGKRAEEARDASLVPRMEARDDATNKKLNLAGIESSKENYALDYTATRLGEESAFASLDNKPFKAARLSFAAGFVGSVASAVRDPLYTAAVVGEFVAANAALPGVGPALLFGAMELDAATTEGATPIIVKAYYNPAETLGELFPYVIAGAGTSAAGRIYTNRAALAAETSATRQLSTSETIGETRVFDESGGYTKKQTFGEVEVSGRTFSVTTETPAESFGLTPGKGNAPVDSVSIGLQETARAEAGAARNTPGVVSSGKSSLSITEAGKEVASGELITRGGGVSVDGGAAFVRASEGTITTTGKKGTTTQVKTIEAGFLDQKQNFGGETVTEGKIGSGGTTRQTATDVIIDTATVEKGKSLTEVQRVNTGMDDVTSFERSSRGSVVVDLTGAEARSMVKDVFRTTSKEQGAPKNPINPAETTGEFAFKQLFGTPEQTIKRGLFERATIRDVNKLSRDPLAPFNPVKEAAAVRFLEQSIPDGPMSKATLADFKAQETAAIKTVEARNARASAALVKLEEAVSSQQKSVLQSTTKTSGAEQQAAGKAIGAVVKADLSSSPGVVVTGGAYGGRTEFRDLNRANFRSFESGSSAFSSDSRSGVESGSAVISGTTQSTAQGVDSRSGVRYAQEQFSKQEIEVNLDQEKLGQSDYTRVTQPTATSITQIQGQFIAQIGAVDIGFSSGQTRTPRPATPTPPAPPPPPIITLGPPRKNDERAGLGTLGARSFVRRRGKFSVVAVGTVEEVTKKADERVRNTAAASFKVESGGKKLGFSSFAGFAKAGFYRPSKIDTAIAVQKRSTRLSSFGEKREIRPRRRRKK